MSSKRSRRSVIAESGAALEQRLAFAYWPERLSAPVAALFAIDAAMGDVVRTTREPMLGPIRLAWWREQLEALDAGGAAPAEPRLRAVQDHLIQPGLRGADIAALADGWTVMFDPLPWSADVADAIARRGECLFALAGTVLERGDGRLECAGGLWALSDAARHCSDPATRSALMDRAEAAAARLARETFERRLRPLTALSALAARDCRNREQIEPEGSRGRTLALLRHQISGRMPSPRR